MFFLIPGWLGVLRHRILLLLHWEIAAVVGQLFSNTRLEGGLVRSNIYDAVLLQWDVAFVVGLFFAIPG